MNKTRKAIIEIIEPYMDKQIYTWILLRDTDWKIVTFLRAWYVYKNYNFVEINDRSDNLEIIWHYDITAVLKYIKSFKWIMCYVFDESFWEWQVFQIWKLADVNQEFWYYYIPNKPLSLYSETEEKDLLELLKQLWTK